MGLQAQASSDQVYAQSKPQVSRQMLPIHCHAGTCWSIVTLECALPAKRSPPKTVNEKKSHSTQSLTFTLTENQWPLLKLTNTIKKTEQHSYTKDKNKQVYSQIKKHNEQLKSITKISKYKKTELQSIKE